MGGNVWGNTGLRTRAVSHYLVGGPSSESQLSLEVGVQSSLGDQPSLAEECYSLPFATIGIIGNI